MQQVELFASRRTGRGGARVGAGRPKLGAQLRSTAHRARPMHRAAQPVHVTLRSSCRSLRSQYVARTVLQALRDSQRESFRIVQYSVQENHLHLLVDASDRTALSSGMRGLAVRMAKRVNRVLFRRGRFWTDRWHGRALKSPREVRNALVYVINNRAKHSHRAGGLELDPLSSAEWFAGFRQALPRGFRSLTPRANAPPRTWLLGVGWKRHGLISIDEVPARNERPRAR